MQVHRHLIGVDIALRQHRLERVEGREALDLHQFGVEQAIFSVRTTPKSTCTNIGSAGSFGTLYCSGREASDIRR
ncbi:MAG: hypothetical protein QM757_46680 [Paludibaculum sp.]